MNYRENRPWGDFENLLESDQCKVKKIIVKPGQALSYQYHHKRSEVWTIVQGIGELKLEEKISTVKYGDVTNIPVGCKHQITNLGEIDLIFIEVQLGDYFGEDDIVRIEDSYGRV